MFSPASLHSWKNRWPVLLRGRKAKRKKRANFQSSFLSLLGSNTKGIFVSDRPKPIILWFFGRTEKFISKHKSFYIGQNVIILVGKLMGACDLIIQVGCGKWGVSFIFLKLGLNLLHAK